MSYSELDSTNSIDIQGLDAGMYILKMDQFEFSLKFVIE